ncbi:AraC family transcriptional regulator [Hyphococcus flavus]|uniref:AraC family transcriptional regulator n=1 Tax=Hyphococcus flavus TaxID=1866326 RepID=A0AAF0CGR2_9PROT|nr:AraC family transcriptional regulator [Hyphococcus flavus]WDI32759.1 AraC family transcriptional regulator [Hyphococcus flavus]
MGFIGSSLATAKTEKFQYGLWTADQVGEDVTAHGHEEAHLMWVMNGAFTTGAEGECKSHQDTIVYNPPETFHTDKIETPGALFFSVTIEPELCQREDDFLLPVAPWKVSNEKTRSRLRRLLSACVIDTENDQLIAESSGYELLSTLSVSDVLQRTPPRWLKRVCDLLRDEAHSSLDEISREAGVHPTHLIRTFRAFLDCTPGEYARSWRLLSVARMLTEQRTPICEIAAVFGYSDQSHMTKQFRRSFGVTPAEFRARTNSF